MPLHEVVIEAGEGTPAGFQVSPNVPDGRAMRIKQGLIVANADNEAAYAIRVGFGASSIPAHAHTGVPGIVASTLGLGAGSPLLMLDATGSVGEALWAIYDDPVGGSFSIVYEYEFA